MTEKESTLEDIAVYSGDNLRERLLNRFLPDIEDRSEVVTSYTTRLAINNFVEVIGEVPLSCKHAVPQLDMLTGWLLLNNTMDFKHDEIFKAFGRLTGETHMGIPVSALMTDTTLKNQDSTQIHEKLNDATVTGYPDGYRDEICTAIGESEVKFPVGKTDIKVIHDFLRDLKERYGVEYGYFKSLISETTWVGHIVRKVIPTLESEAVLLGAILKYTGTKGSKNE